VRVWKIHIVLK